MTKHLGRCALLPSFFSQPSSRVTDSLHKRWGHLGTGRAMPRLGRYESSIRSPGSMRLRGACGA